MREKASDLEFSVDRKCTCTYFTLFQLRVLWPVEAKSDEDKPDHDSKR